MRRLIFVLRVVSCLSAASGGSIDGSGATNRVTYWSDSDTLTSNAGFTFDGTDLTIPGDINTPTAFYIGSSATSSGSQSLAIGTSASSTDEFSVAIGRQASASADNALALGEGASAAGLSSIAVGDATITSGSEYSVAIGEGALVMNNQNLHVAIGYFASTFGLAPIAIGANSNANVRIYCYWSESAGCTD